MSLTGKAAIVGCSQYRPEKYATAPQMFHLEQIADLARLALIDAGLTLRDIDGLAVNGAHFNEATAFVPAVVAEYLGLQVGFAETVDLGGTSAVAMAWRAAAAIQLGLCRAVLCVLPGRLAPPDPDADPAAVAAAMQLGAHSGCFGAPEAEFDLPYGHVGQNTGYAMIAQQYAHRYGYDAAAMAGIAVAQRSNAQANPEALFYGQPISVEDVLNSKMVADPLHILEIVMPVAGGAAFIVAADDLARECRHRPVLIRGCGEQLDFKSPSYARDMTVTPIARAAQRAFLMAGMKPADMDMAQIYDCYTITVLLSLEDAGFCAKGEGMAFVRDHDLTWRGDFPLNTHGGQLSFGQAGTAGGMSQLIEAVTQIRGSAGERQLHRHDTAFVSGTGGVMSEQGALILTGA